MFLNVLQSFPFLFIYYYSFIFIIVSIILYFTFLLFFKVEIKKKNTTGWVKINDFNFSVVGSFHALSSFEICKIPQTNQKYIMF